MPFSYVAHQYQPEQLAALTQAFDQAWPEVLLANGANKPSQIGWLRKRLASHILANAENERFDPGKLAELAVRSLARRAPESFEQ